MCLGLPLANRMLHVILGSLLHQFEWQLPELERGVDMTEKYGLVLSMATPIHAMRRKGNSSAYLPFPLFPLNRHIFFTKLTQTCVQLIVIYITNFLVVPFQEFTVDIYQHYGDGVPRQTGQTDG